MSDFRTEVVLGDRHIRFNCAGTASTEAYRELVDKIVSVMADPALVRKVFVDISGIQGDLPPMAKYTLGEYIPTVLLGMRLAVLMNRETPNTRFGENTAVNRGASLLVGHDEGELLAWLNAPTTLDAGGKSRQGPGK